MKRPLEIFAENKEILEDYCYRWGLDYPSMYLAYDDGDEKELIRLANRAWNQLPDRRDIREAGFFRLCDIAEFMFE